MLDKLLNVLGLARASRVHSLRVELNEAWSVADSRGTYVLKLERELERLSDSLYSRYRGQANTALKEVMVRHTVAMSDDPARAVTVYTLHLPSIALRVAKAWGEKLPQQMCAREATLVQEAWFDEFRALLPAYLRHVYGFEDL